MKLKKLWVVALSLALFSGMASAAQKTLAIDDDEDKPLTPLEAVKNAQTLLPALLSLAPKGNARKTVKKYATLGLDMAEFGLTAEVKVASAKEKMSASLKSLGAAQISIKDLTAKLKLTKDPNEQDAIMLAILEQVVAPLDTFTEFMKVAGKEIFAESLILLERIDPAVANVMTFKDGETMGQLISKDVDSMRNLAILLKQLLPKLKTSLQAKGVATAPVVVITPTVEENPFGDL